MKLEPLDEQTLGRVLHGRLILAWLAAHLIQRLALPVLKGGDDGNVIAGHVARHERHRRAAQMHAGHSVRGR